MGQASSTLAEALIKAIAEIWRQNMDQLHEPEHGPNDDDERDMGPRQALPDERLGDASLSRPVLGRQSVWNLACVDYDLAPSQHWFASPDQFEKQVSGHASRRPVEADPTAVEDDGDGGLGGVGGNELQWEEVDETRPLLSAADRSGSGPHFGLPQTGSSPRPQASGQTQQGSVDPSGEAAPVACAMTVPSGIGHPDWDPPPPYTPRATTPANTVPSNEPAPERTPLPDGPPLQPRDGLWSYRDGEWRYSDPPPQPRDSEWRYSNGDWLYSDEQSPFIRYGPSFSGRSPYDRSQRSIKFIHGEAASGSSPYIEVQPAQPARSPPPPPSPEHGETSSGPSGSSEQRRDSPVPTQDNASPSTSSGRVPLPNEPVTKPIDIVRPGGSRQRAPSPETNLSTGPPRQGFAGRVQFSSPPDSRPRPIDPDMPHDKGDTRWSSVHLRGTRASLASNPKSKAALKKQTLEEMKLREKGMDLRGPPPARVRRRRHPTTIKSALSGGEPSEEPLSPEPDYSPLGENMPMPHPPPESSYDPLAAHIGEPTVRISNPSTVMGALIPKKHFPGAPIEFEITSTGDSPDLVMLLPHECETRCPEDCRQGGGRKKKGKENEVSDDEYEAPDYEYEPSDDEYERSEPMEGVEYGNNPTKQALYADDERELTEEEREQDILNRMGDWAVIERHRAQQAAEMGAITGSARVLSCEMMTISLNSNKEHPSDAEREDPARIIREKVIDLVERRVENEREEMEDYERRLHLDIEAELLKKQAEDLEARRHVREARKAAKVARRAERAEARAEEERATQATEARAAEDAANEVAVDSVSLGSSSDGEGQVLNPPLPSPPDDEATSIHVEDTEILDEPTSSHVEVVEVVENNANMESEKREPPALWIMQRDGTFIRNPLADTSTSTGAPSDPLPRRRWSSTSVGNPASGGPDPSPRTPLQRSVTVSEGSEPDDSPPRPPLRLLLEPVQDPRPDAVPADDGLPDDKLPVINEGDGQDNAMGSESSEGGFDMTRPRLRRESFRVSDIPPREEEPPRGTFGPDSAALVADAGGSQIPLVVPTTETTNQGGGDDYFGSGSDDEWFDEVDEGPVRREPGLTTITTPPRPSEEDLPNRPRYSSSLLRTETLLEDIFSEDLVLTPAIEATHVPFSRATSPNYYPDYPSPSPLSGSRFVEDLPELQRFSSSYRETGAPSPVPLTTFTSVEAESDTTAVTSVPATPASGSCPPRTGLDALAREQAEHVSRAFGVCVGGDGAGDLPSPEDGYENTWGHRYFPSSPILLAPRPSSRSPRMEPYRRPSDTSIRSLRALQRGAEGEREGSVTGEVVETLRGLGVGSPLGRDGGEEEMIRKREDEVSVQVEEEDGEGGGNGAPLQRCSSQVR